MKRNLIVLCLLIATSIVLFGTVAGQNRSETELRTDLMAEIAQAGEVRNDVQPQPATPCVAGMAGIYPCDNVDLMAFVPLASLGGGGANDIWGWTGCNGREFALMGRTNGSSFVEVTDPENPVYLGNLPTHTSTTTWRDIKTYADHAFIVSEANGHGMQVFDLTQLCNVANPPQNFSNTAHYNGFSSAHNVVINEDSGYAYGVGTNNCSGGLHMVDISTPTSPSFAGCYSGDGYTHDAQCVNYNGPDTDYAGREICINSNEDTVTIVDVTNKNSPQLVAREVGWPGCTAFVNCYIHQNWLTEDHEYLLVDDELDEALTGIDTTTYIWDVRDLDNPVPIGDYDSGLPASDHNQYIKGDYTYQSNYAAGLRILDISDIANGTLSEVAYFDVYPANNNAGFSGSWSNYPFFDSGIVVVTERGSGLMIVRPNLPTPTAVTIDAVSVETQPLLVLVPFLLLTLLTAYGVHTRSNDINVILLR